MVLWVAYSQSENFLIKRMGRFGGSRMGRGLFESIRAVLNFHIKPENILSARKSL